MKSQVQKVCCNDSKEIPQAFIATKDKSTGTKNRLKIYGKCQDIKKVYLNDNEEFLIELFNPNSFKLLSAITIQGNPIGNSKGLVLYPGQRVFLKRYLDSNNAFVFKIYNVEKVMKHSIENNGSIEIKFYKEKENTTNKNYNLYINYRYYPIIQYPTIQYPSWPANQPFWGSTVNSSVCNSSIVGNASSSSDISQDAEINESIKTGIIDKGLKTTQEFSETYGDFEDCCFHSIEYKILPMSEKLDTIDKIDTCRCKCGKKIKDNYKFCPKCGKEQ